MAFHSNHTLRETMGFLKRLLSIGRPRDKKSDRARPGNGSDTSNQHQIQQTRRQPSSSSSSVPSSSLQPPLPQHSHRSKPRNNTHLSPPRNMKNENVEEDASEVAVSRLLRSASAHFKVVSETNYDVLPPIRMWLYVTHPVIVFLF